MLRSILEDLADSLPGGGACLPVECLCLCGHGLLRQVTQDLARGRSHLFPMITTTMPWFRLASDIRVCQSPTEFRVTALVKSKTISYGFPSLTFALQRSSGRDEEREGHSRIRRQMRVREWA
jgi:hypothetical protein